MYDGSTSRRSKERTLTPTGRGAQASRKSRTGQASTRPPAHKRELVYETEKLRLEAQLDIPNEGKGDPEDIESRLRDFGDAEDKTVYCDIKPKISENVENRENPDDPLPQQNMKLPSPIKSSTLCKQTPQIDQKGKGDPEDIESRLRDFGDAEDKTVYCDIKPKISENVENRENPDDPLPQQNMKLPSPIKSSTLCKQTPQIDQAYCDTDERLGVSWIKELAAKQRTTKGETNLQSTPAFVKSIPR